MPVPTTGAGTSGFGVSIPTKGPDFAPHNMTGYALPAPYVALGSGEFFPFYYYTAFDGLVSATHYWLVDSTAGWLRLDIGAGNAKVLYSYAVRVNSIPEPNRAPKDWTLKASNNGVDFDTLDTVTGQTGWGSGESREFVCDVIVSAYRYFRIDITVNNGDASFTQVAEMYLYEAV